jgi:hypothetical protein
MAAVALVSSSRVNCAVETDEEQPAELTRFVSNSSSPMAFSRRGSSILVHASDRVPISRNGSHLNGMVDGGGLLKPPKVLVTDPDHLKHLHVLIVEGECEI